MSQKNLENEKTQEISTSPLKVFIRSNTSVETKKQMKQFQKFKNQDFTNCSTCGIEFGMILDKQKIWFISLFFFKKN